MRIDGGAGAAKQLCFKYANGRHDTQAVEHRVREGHPDSGVFGAVTLLFGEVGYVPVGERQALVDPLTWGLWRIGGVRKRYGDLVVCDGQGGRSEVCQGLVAAYGS